MSHSTLMATSLCPSLHLDIVRLVADELCADGLVKSALSLFWAVFRDGAGRHVAYRNNVQMVNPSPHIRDETDDVAHCIERHTAFLQHMLSQPESHPGGDADDVWRYVRVFAQTKLALVVPVGGRISRHNSAKCELWKLMLQALPKMGALKTLHFEPAESLELSEPDYSVLLKVCWFQLENLMGHDTAEDKPSHETLAFLQRQRHLKHLELGLTPSIQDFSSITQSMCPELESVACSFQSLAAFAESRNVIALYGGRRGPEISGAAEIDQLQAALQKLRYLRVQSYRMDYAALTRGIHMYVDVLEVNEIKDVAEAIDKEEDGVDFTNLKSIRILSFVAEEQGGNDNVDEDDMERISKKAFDQCSSLERVIFWYPHEKGLWSYTRECLTDTTSVGRRL